MLQKYFLLPFTLTLLGLPGCSWFKERIDAIWPHSAMVEKPLTIGEVDPAFKPLSHTPLDRIEKEHITYYVTGKSNYDKFTKASAISYGGLAVANAVTDDATDALHKFEKGITPECQALNVFKNTLPNLGTAGVTVKGSIKSMKELLPQGKELLNNAKNDFKSIDLSTVTKALNGSLDQLSKVKDEGPALLSKTMKLETRLQDIVVKGRKDCA
jgi:hypothetical protein